MREAADELREELAGETVTFVVNRNINVSNVCTVGCAFCGFGQGKRSPDAYEHDREEFVRRVLEAIEYGASELCIQSGIHPGLEPRGLPRVAAAREGRPRARPATDLHLHAYSPMEIAHMCDISGLPPSEVFAQLRDAGLGSTPGTAAEVLHDGVRERISPNKLPVARWVEIIEASHHAGLRSTATVMFGHIEEPWELAEHMRVDPRAAGTHGRDHRVRAAVVHPLSDAARAHARGGGDLPRGEPQAHRRLPPRARPDGSEPAGELGEDGSRGGHRVAALGRQRPRRHADGGVDQPPGGLLPRYAPGPRAARRRRARGGQAGGRAHDAVRAQAPLSVEGRGRCARGWRCPRPPDLSGSMHRHRGGI